METEAIVTAIQSLERAIRAVGFVIAIEIFAIILLLLEQWGK